MKEMIRYSRIGTVPKNTLYTFRDNDLIRFGISRCDNTEDTFSKEKGKSIAKARAEKTISEQPLDWWQTTGYNQGTGVVCVDDTGLRGVVHVDSVGKLLEHFRDIDTFDFKRR